MGDPTLSQAGVQITKAIIDIAGPLGISVPDYIIVRKNGTPARRAEADLGWRHPASRRAASAGLVRARCPSPRFTKSATVYSIPLAEFGLPQSEKMFRHDGGG